MNRLHVGVGGGRSGVLAGRPLAVLDSGGGATTSTVGEEWGAGADGGRDELSTLALVLENPTLSEAVVVSEAGSHGTELGVSSDGGGLLSGAGGLDVLSL